MDARGTSTPACTLVGGTPRGLAYVESTNQFLVAEQGVDAVQVFDAATCVMQRIIDVQALGVLAASDVAFLPGSNEIVVVDEGTNDLFFVDAARGTLNSRCDLAPQGLEIPRGLVALPELDLVAVSAYEHRAWALLDASCEVVHPRPLSFLAGDQPALPTAEAIAWAPSTGRFLHAAGGMVFVSTFEGTPVFRFDTPGLSIQGLAADPSDPAAFWVQSYGNIERVVLPRLAEDPSISGRYASATATVYLWDRGEGKVTGTALVGGDTLPLFGELSGGGGTLVMGTITGAGAPMVVPVTVSADLQTLTAPAPVGVLTRQ